MTLAKRTVASANKKARELALVARVGGVGGIGGYTPAIESALTTRQLFGVADAYALAAARIVEVRLARRAEMTDPEARIMERSEDRLSKTFALLRVSELRFINASGEHIARLIADTVDAAARALGTGSITRVVALGQSLADFAGTVLTRDATQVELAAQQLRSLVRRRSRQD